MKFFYFSSGQTFSVGQKPDLLNLNGCQEEFLASFAAKKKQERGDRPAKNKKYKFLRRSGDDGIINRRMLKVFALGLFLAPHSYS